MKVQNLLVNTLVGCLLMGASGAAMAVGCPNGSIIGGVVDEIVIEGVGQESLDCIVVNVTVMGRVRVVGADQFTMMGSRIGGALRAQESTSVALVENEVWGGPLVASSNRHSTVIQNIVNGGDIRVNKNSMTATVVENLVRNGNMLVKGNEKADVIDNFVGGNIRCPNNDRLDSFFNVATGTIEDCSDNVGTLTGTLTVETEIGGSVTSNPPGINCNGGNTCSQEVPLGTVVTLTSTPDPGNVFDDWDGCDLGTAVENPGGGTCAVTIQASNFIRAEFDPAP